MSDLIRLLDKGLIVSCQAFENEPLYGGDTITKLAIAAAEGGACAVRINNPHNIKEVKSKVNVPVFGINKLVPENYNKITDVIITPTKESALAILEAGADIIAIDCTLREGRTKEDIKNYIEEIKGCCNVPIMCEISTIEEGLMVEEYGADIISTTVAGYTPYSKLTEGPDFELIENLVKKCKVPINAEGRFNSPEDVVKALQLGAWTVTVGSAITRPQVITRKYIDTIREGLKDEK